MTAPKILSLASLAGLALALGACGGNQDGGKDGDPTVCVGAKCDTPQADNTEERTQQCLDRQDEVLESSKRAFTEDFVRWSCGDVEGVNTKNQDDRGQEYCEYFAIVDLPGHDAIDLGRRRSNEGKDVTASGICVEGEKAFSEAAADNCAFEITEDDLFDLEDNADAVVGQCIFTSWMSDVPGPLPCDKGSGCTDDVLGFPVNAEYFQMKLETNSNATASSLVQACSEMRAKESFLAPVPDFANPDDEFHSPFFRGCWMAGAFGLAWRRSDPAICAVANRLIECGCEIAGVDRENIGATVVPPEPGPDGTVGSYGPQLGSFEDPDAPPPGCQYVRVGGDHRVVMACDLTAADVVGNLSDPKEACRQIYGNNVIVHARVPTDVISCSNPGTQLAQGCGEMPWNIGREFGDGEPPSP